VPFELLADIRRDGGVARTPSGSWYVGRHADVEAVLRDVGAFRTDLAPTTGLPGVEDVPEEELFLSEIEEPRHGEVRRLYNVSLGPQRTRELEPFVRQVCHRLVDDLLARDPADLHGGYAAAIPGIVLARVLELPDDAAARFMAWSADGSLMQRPSSPGVGAGGPPSHAYFSSLLAEERARPEPTSHVFRILLGAQVAGEPLTDTEIATQLHFMVMAGVHTTRGLLIHVVQRLVHDPVLFARLQADRSLIANYVEESLRFDSPVQRTTRRCTAARDVAGVRMHPGDWIEVGVASGNRDESRYDRPAEFRLDRADPRDHLAFGTGPHVCPGATLARLEATTAVDVLCERLDSMSEVPGATYPPLPGNLAHKPVPAMLVAGG
jgi:cytochrome P450